ncbi:hypothetical protein D0T12_11655 [Actinomadura spongiicola]|uniref:Uncharacterized protein n=1 Tax=Actinomadura spongiicola TaxID=2303421 RepID=A0A372GJX3_9ACTN|nr:hypothetical protein [Actinomadura spongiicola]RFS85657.1 hypothetical protein D0T12_11655 [Actinomadura spongiicola]
MTVSVLNRWASTAHRGPGRLRLAVCAVTVAACVPYLTIKLAWLSGSTVGWNDAEAAKSSALYVGNAITMGMDAVAVLVVLAFTFPWGRRVPAWMVLTPIWVGAGLLAPIGLALPIGVAVQTLFSDEPLIQSGAGDELQSWVYGVVYTGFTVQGVGLLVAFLLYARDRWPDVFTVRTKDVARGATHGLQVLMARTAGVFAAVFAAVQFYWAFGGTAGIRAEELARRGPAHQTIDGVMGLLAVAGAVTLLLIVQRGRRPARFAVPLAGAWIGTGATFAWSLYELLTVLSQPEFLDSGSTSALNLTVLCGLLAGLLMGVTGAVLLAERGANAQSARPTASSAP